MWLWLKVIGLSYEEWNVRIEIALSPAFQFKFKQESLPAGGYYWENALKTENRGGSEVGFSLHFDSPLSHSKHFLASKDLWHTETYTDN